MVVCEYVVAIVVDPAFGERLHALIGRMPVWVADTPPNRAAAEAHWRTRADTSDTEGLTTFLVDPDQAPEDWCAGALDAVILHHGEHSHDPPVTVLEVVGARPVQRLVAVLVQYGFAEVRQTREGFQARCVTR